MAGLLTLDDFHAQARSDWRLLGLDVGTVRLGLALGTVGIGIASPLATWERGAFQKDAGRLAELVAREQVSGVVVGLPLNMDGSQGPRAQSIRAFARQLGPRINRPIALWDERWSTVAADRQLIAHDVTRARRKETVDAGAAAFILQGFLDRLRFLDAEEGPAA